MSRQVEYLRPITSSRVNSPARDRRAPDAAREIREPVDATGLDERTAAPAAERDIVAARDAGAVVAGTVCDEPAREIPPDTERVVVWGAVDAAVFARGATGVLVVRD